MADFIGKIKGTIDKSVATVSIKSNEFVEVTKYKTQMTALEREVNELEQTLGKGYFRKWESNATDFHDIIEICQAIKRKRSEIQECKARMEALQNENKKILNANDANKCLKCGAINKPEARFCLGCGQCLIDPDTVICACGAKVKKTAKFCPICGNKMEAPVEAQVEEPVALHLEKQLQSVQNIADVEASNESEIIEEVTESHIVEDVTVTCQCGEVYPTGTKFCGKCGSSLLV